MGPATWLLPEELRKARERRSLSQAEAAASIGIPTELLHRWEAGE
ncbi:MAG: helix-turn-helix transcriptional regulator, partial [Chloroflexi bacterium]|nr:helix-turn-helix transcriptional regulator [Chloroflexota bacterium]